MNPEEQAGIDALRRLSARVGADPALVQAAGGNTSIKCGNVMWIKASGTWLANALTSDILVPVDLARLRTAVETGNEDPDDTDRFRVLDLGTGTLRPSVETSLHAVFPQTVVVHVHCVETIAHAVRADAEAVLGPKLDGLDWAFVDYCKPGARLANAVRKALGPKTDVVVLRNHGLIVAAGTVEEAEALLDDVTRRLALEPAPELEADPDSLAEMAAGSGYRPSRTPEAHQTALRPETIVMAEGGSLYPDHVIFCGVGTAVVRDGETVADAAKRSVGPDGKPPLLMLVPGKGALLRDDCGKSNEALARCLADVTRRIAPGTELSYLSLEENMELIDWDAEKYRLALNVD